ncbi:4'-phosphopantetheinyl transferase [Phanerochaete sordida]|uniref:4'-phosphopantetheinyl transferase n=1 Tax=Phanerochaete sordida TaxID=48140 RepID=A0A9P3FYN9_9APHY|nr:4'-phosphopantetheinyl transferase [Phanerochaete sordida]
MAILGIGVDVVHVPRIAALIRRRGTEPLAARILSPRELDDWRAVRDLSAQTRFLAVRWSVKEAAYKALFPVDRPTWKEFSVSRLQGNKPTLLYKPTRHSAASQAIFHCSVSHDGDYVFSTVLVEQP